MRRSPRLGQPFMATDKDIEPKDWLERLIERAFELGGSDVFLTVHAAADGDEITRVDGHIRLNNEMVPQDHLEGPRSKEVPIRIKQRAEISTGNLISPGEGAYPHVREERDASGAVINSEQLPLRVTLYPTDLGQFISMRIPPTGGIKALDELGFSNYNRARFDKVMAKPGGLTVLAGPMGSGKTTTLYSAVLTVGGPTKSVITVEDPKERTLPGAHQIQISEPEMTYALVLKSLLRVVLDVLLIGEVRDHDTAEAAIRIATAGTRVLTSIHADDPVTAIAKIVSYSGDTAVNVLSGISGIVSQRMVRLVCKSCQTRGCEQCAFSGYSGKAPIHEVLVNTPPITEAFIAGWRNSDIRGLAIHEGMMTFHQDAARLVAQGLTTREEVEATIGFDTNEAQRVLSAGHRQAAPQQQVQRPPVQQAPQQGVPVQRPVAPQQPQQAPQQVRPVAPQPVAGPAPVTPAPVPVPQVQHAPAPAQVAPVQQAPRPVAQQPVPQSPPVAGPVVPAGPGIAIVQPRR